MKPLLLSSLFLFAVANPVFSQVKYKGVIKISVQQSIKNINATWNNADHTGNTSLDKLLDKFAAANKNNSAAIKALEGTSAEVKTSPQKYINEDGSVNLKAFQLLLNQKFASVREVTIPSVDTVASEGSSN